MILSLHFCWFVVLGRMGSATAVLQTSILQRKWWSLSVTVSVKACDLCDDATKTESRWLALLLSGSFWKSICPHICIGSHQNYDRQGSCGSDLPLKVMMGALWHAWRLPTLFYSPAAQLSSVSVISQPFFFFFHGILQRMRGEYQCCLLADNSTWLRVVFIKGQANIPHYIYIQPAHC